MKSIKDIAGNDVHEDDTVFVISRWSGDLGWRHLLRTRVTEVHAKSISTKYGLHRERTFIKDLSKQVEKLEDRDNFLAALEAYGVDNWCGYDEACQEYNKDHKEI